MSILLVDNGTTLLGELEQLIPGQEIVRRSVELTREDLFGHDLVVLSGSSSGPLVERLHEFKVILDFLKSTTKPVLGVCFGCELINVAFGGTLRELGGKHTGIRAVEVISPDPIFGDRKKLQVYEQHRWIIDRVADDFNVLAQSIDGPEVIKHSSLPIYGLQFHPEHLVEATDGDEVFRVVFQSLML